MYIHAMIIYPSIEVHSNVLKSVQIGSKFQLLSMLQAEMLHLKEPAGHMFRWATHWWSRFTLHCLLAISFYLKTTINLPGWYFAHKATYTCSAIRFFSASVLFCSSLILVILSWYSLSFFLSSLRTELDESPFYMELELLESGVLFSWPV